METGPDHGLAISKMSKFNLRRWAFDSLNSLKLLVVVPFEMRVLVGHLVHFSEAADFEKSIKVELPSETGHVGGQVVLLEALLSQCLFIRDNQLATVLRPLDCF